MVRVTANAMTNTPTNVTKTNQCPAFVAYRRKEVCMHPHAEKRVRTPTEQPIHSHMSSTLPNLWQTQSDPLSSG